MWFSIYRTFEEVSGNSAVVRVKGCGGGGDSQKGWGVHQGEWTFCSVPTAGEVQRSVE